MSRLRSTLGVLGTVLAVALVWAALVAPDQLSDLTPGAFVRIPLEGLALGALVLLLPPRPRTVLVAVVGGFLGLLTVLKVLDVGFHEALGRSFDALVDWRYAGSAAGVLQDSLGRTRAIVVIIIGALLAVGLLLLMPLALVRLSRVAHRHRAVSVRVLGITALAWVVCAVSGAALVGGTPIASTSAVDYAYGQVSRIPTELADQREFARAAAHDPLRRTPASDLLTGLRGKDVIVAFVESYGQVAVQGSTFSPAVEDVLDRGTGTLATAGFSARSAWLTSPTFGAVSWLAHSTLQSGLWVNSQQRYDAVVTSGRQTLSDAFRRAGWRTVGDVPANTHDWPEGRSFYHYDQLYDSRNVGYAGPKFSYAPMPDQYTLDRFRRNELTRRHHPVFAEIDLVSSHAPWTPLPHLVPWRSLGDGSVFDPMPAQGKSPVQVAGHADQVQAVYGQSIQYTLSALVGWVKTYGDDNLVLVVLGDHQPATIVSGDDATHDVPVSVIARDPRVLSRIGAWGWQPGLRPAPDAPVWRMDAFRGRFLSAFGPGAGR